MQKKDSKKKSDHSRKQTVSPNSGNFLTAENFMLLLPALLPLLYSDKAVDVTVPVRYFFLSLFLLVYLLVFRMISRKQLQWSSSVLLNTVFGLSVGFAAWQMVTMGSAVNKPAVYYEVSLQMLMTTLLFVLLYHFNTSVNAALNFSKVLLVVSLLQSFIGFCQLYEVGFLNIPGHSSPYALNANGNFFGSAQMLLLPFVLYVWYAAEKPWKTLSALALTGILVSLISSKTRAAWLGSAVVVSLSVLLIAVFVAEERKRWLKLSAYVALAIPILAVVLIFTAPDGKLAKALTERTGINATSADTTNHSSQTAKDRLVIWKKTTAIIQQHPITGVGAGNWKLIVPLYGTEGTAWQNASYVPDHVHNIYLQVAAETGIPGALLYFGVFVLMAFMALKVLTNQVLSAKKILVVLMLAGMAGYLTDGFFSFANQRIEHLLYATVMMAIVMQVYDSELNGDKKFSIPMGVYILLAAVAGFNLYFGYHKYNFEKQLNRVRAYEKKQNYQKAISEGALGKNALVKTDEVGTSIESHTALAYKNLKDFPTALNEIRKAEKINPGNSKVYNTMGTIYTDMTKFDSAVLCYNRALELNGKMEVALKNLTVNYFQLKNYSAAVATMNRWDNSKDSFFISLKAECELQLHQQK